MQTALVLLLGPETSYHMRIRARRRLARQGPETLLFILTALSSYPEITTPAWPWWPPQYEHCSHLLLHFCKKFSLGLNDLLHYPGLKQPAGPVLWISIIEGAMEHEGLLRKGLELPWAAARYAAAIALANLASQKPLSEETLIVLRRHYQEHEDDSIRLSVSYALLASGEHSGLEPLIQLLQPHLPEETRKAALFILATELPYNLSTEERTRVTGHLLAALQDANGEVATHAAHALSRVAQPGLLAIIIDLLWQPQTQLQINVLAALEEMAKREDLRRKMRHLALPTYIIPLLQSEIREVRRQAYSTLAACGGNFVLAVLGTHILYNEQGRQLEAIESLRLLPGVLQTKTCAIVMRWLFKALQQTQEEIQITVLDCLAHLLWQARAQRRKQVWQEICQAIILDGEVVKLLDSNSAWVRQRAIELLSIFEPQIANVSDFHSRLLDVLLHDPDNGVRACVAFICGQIGARWAIPSLIHTLLDSDEYVAETALNALSQLMTEEDSIIRYIIQELASFNNPRLIGYSSQHLSQAAQVVLKSWQKVRKQVRQSGQYCTVQNEGLYYKRKK